MALLLQLSGRQEHLLTGCSICVIVIECVEVALLHRILISQVHVESVYAAANTSGYALLAEQILVLCIRKGIHTHVSEIHQGTVCTFLVE